MTIDDFKASNPDSLSGALLALWWDGQGDWEQAHQVAQEVAGPDGAWVHAYLHRKEGDTANAAYWYRRAARPITHQPLEAEWTAMVHALLASQTA